MDGALTRRQMAERVSRDLTPGMFVNLGIGLPTLVADFVDEELEVILHSENGVVGVGRAAAEGHEDMDLIDAGKTPVTLVTGGSYVNHTESFAMIRGGHLDLAVLGAYQVSRRGDLANWSAGSTTDAPAVGGAMDLAVGAKRVAAIMSHCARDGAPKLVDQCSLPLTAVGAVDRIYTDLAVIDVVDERLVVVEMIAGLERNDLQERTGAPLTWDPSLGTLATASSPEAGA